jgi:two-component system sensor histidine kinase/response regulator
MFAKTVDFLGRIATSSAPATNPDDTVHATVVNVASMFGVGITIYYALFYFIVDAQTFAPIIIGDTMVIFMHLIAIRANRRGRFYFAKIVFFTVTLSQLVFATCFLGRDGGTHLFILSMPALGLLIFGHEELKSRVGVMLICGLLFALCHYLFKHHIIPDYPDFVDVMLFSFSVTGMLALQFVGVFSFSQRLKATKENLQVALDYMPGGMMAMDANNDVMLANTRVNELYDLPPNSVKEGKSLRQIVERILANGGTDDAGAAFSVDGTLDRFSSKENSSVVLKTGNNRVVEVMIAPTPLGGSVAISTDISERKKMISDLREAKDLAEEATRAKSDFLANMSHEIRTPMNAILGMTHLALKTELNSKQSDYLQKAHNSATSLLGIINDILDFSKIEAGKLDMEAVDFNLDEALSNVAALIGNKAQEKGLEFLFQVPSDLPRFLVGDPLRLGQVLINLSNNAVKFTESGEVVISVERIEESETEVTLKFTVRDTGIGLTEKQIGKLFQSFSQADSSTTRKYGGTGLGLTISKKLTEMMRGEIWVESVSGEGSSFIFTAKFAKAETAEQAGWSLTEDLRHKPVLVVDDNETSRLIFKEILESFSFEVTLANSGIEGIEAVGQANPAFELVLMDWQMPGLDGFKTIEEIRNLSGLAQQPKIILATAFNREDIIKEAEEAQLDGFMIKPVDPSMMFDAVMGAFGKQGARSSRLKIANDYDTESLRPVLGAHILLAEDNEINQQIAQELLEGAGFFVDIANNGVEAVKMVGAGNYDLVLMDVQMPEMDGHEATMRIREESAFKDLPILAMTAGAMTEDKERAKEAGMNDHVSKPIEIRKLFEALAQWIKPGERSVPLMEKQATNAELEDKLPRYVDGVNMELGLRRTGGSPRLYRDLLLKFRDSNAEVIQEIRAALQGNGLELAIRLAHTLTGVAGNLGANDLALAAKDLELGITSDGAEVAPILLESTQSHLDKVISALSVIQREDRPHTTAGPINWDQAQETLVQLRDSLGNYDTKALDLISQLSGQLSDEIFAEPLQAIAVVVDSYEFEMALDHLVELEELVSSTSQNPAQS